MAKYSKGDHVSWNSEAGWVSGSIIEVHEQDFDNKATAACLGSGTAI